MIPPSGPPLPTRVCQRILPSWSGSSAWTTPDFLPGNQDTLSAAHRHQDRRLTKVVVRTVAFRTVGAVANKARRDVCVVCGTLPMPEQPAGREFERKNRIAGFRGRVGIIVPCRDIEHLALHVDGGRRPHPRAGRTIELGPRGIPLCRTRRLG